MLSEKSVYKEKIAIIDYGAGNIQSLKFSLERLGFRGFLSSDPKKIAAADKVIFPGVGEAGSAMKKLKNSGLDQLIPELRQPVLGICLGMQLLCEHSEEGNTRGLGIFEGEVRKFSGVVKVPQIGWNQIYDFKSPIFKGIPENAFIYMVHSYYAPISSNTISRTEYGTEYSSAIQNRNFIGLQFHPEKSGTIGEQILSNFLKLENLKFYNL